MWKIYKIFSETGFDTDVAHAECENRWSFISFILALNERDFKIIHNLPFLFALHCRFLLFYRWALCVPSLRRVPIYHLWPLTRYRRARMASRHSVVAVACWRLEAAVDTQRWTVATRRVKELTWIHIYCTKSKRSCWIRRIKPTVMVTEASVCLNQVTVHRQAVICRRHLLRTVSLVLALHVLWAFVSVILRYFRAISRSLYEPRCMFSLSLSHLKQVTSNKACKWPSSINRWLLHPPRTEFLLRRNHTAPHPLNICRRHHIHTTRTRTQWVGHLPTICHRVHPPLSYRRHQSTVPPPHTVHQANRTCHHRANRMEHRRKRSHS